MVKQILGLFVVCAGLSACSSEPLRDGRGPDSEIAESGTLGLPLVTETSGATYRLNGARFTIAGAALDKPRTFVAKPDEPIHSETLPAGSYTIALEGDWKLERKNDTEKGASFEGTTATLISPNPMAFEIARDALTQITWSFATNSGAVNLGRGQLDVGISVQDCSAYDQYSAALATLTVDCLGTIDNRSYALDARGFLTRNFKVCVEDQSLLQSIDDLLGLQFRTKQLPYGRECIAGRWAEWQKRFEASGISVCPIWKKSQVFNEPTDALIESIIPRLPKLPAKDTAERPEFIADLKTLAEYVVAFEKEPPAQKCETPGACGVQCAGGFPGFVIRNESTSVLTDPTYWLIDKLYPSAEQDPFMKPGYYHPMSYYGPLPGALFGHRNRIPEKCSHYAGGIHYILPLKLDCLDTGDYTSCVSQCIP